MSAIPSGLIPGKSTLVSAPLGVLPTASGTALGDPLVAGTQTLVPCLTNANPSLTLFGSGGGGGGSNYPPNISVSSINVNSLGFIEMFQNQTNECGRIIGYGDINNTSSLSLLVGFVPNYQNKINGNDGLWLVENDATGANQAFADFGSGRFVVLGNNAGPGQKPPVLDSDGNGGLEIQAISTINISTPTLFLNGAPITGGGVNPNGISTQSIALTDGTQLFSFKDGFYPNASIDLNMTTSNAAQIQFNPKGANISSFYIGTDSVNAGIENTGPGILSLKSPLGTSISSLTVSSINGAAPGGGNAPFFSTLNQSPTTIDCDGQTTTPLLQFSTIVSHLYMIQTQMTIQPRTGQAQTGTMADSVVQEILNELDLNQTVGSLISSMDAANNDLRIGTTGMWKANQTGQILDIFTTFSTTVQLGDVYLTDFGAV